MIQPSMERTATAPADVRASGPGVAVEDAPGPIAEFAGSPDTAGAVDGGGELGGRVSTSISSGILNYERFSY